MARYPGFVGPSYTSQSKIAAADRCVNWYPEQIELASGQSGFALYPVPGYLAISSVAAPFRGGYTLNGQTFAVGGSNLYELTNITATSATATLRGSGLNNPDNQPCTFACNGDGGFQLLLSSGSQLYLYDLRSQVFSALNVAASYCGFLDGFFLALDPSTSTFKISALEDGSASQWDATQVAQRNDAPDKWLGMQVVRKEIWFFGSQTSNVFYNAGLAPFPFIPNPSVFVDEGGTAPWSIATLGGAPVWLAQTKAGGGVVKRANGYTPERISTHALEWAMSLYPTLLDAQGWVYSELGHTFYVLKFPAAGATWVYDESTGLWHERGDFNGYDFSGEHVYGHMFAAGYHLTGDAAGVIYRQGVDIATGIDGNGRRRLRRAPHLSSDGKRLIVDRLQVEFEAGLALLTGQGSNPAFSLRWSDDGGQTWGSWHDCSAGVRGAYKARAIWRRLGLSRDRVFELQASDPIPWRIVDAFIDARSALA
jgi:hypothetical protein